jgi:hypothetical protein
MSRRRGCETVHPHRLLQPGSDLQLGKFGQAGVSADMMAMEDARSCQLRGTALARLAPVAEIMSICVSCVQGPTSFTSIIDRGEADPEMIRQIFFLARECRV